MDKSNTSLVNGVLVFNSSMPIISKASGRQVVNSINFMLIALASNLIREDLRLNPEGDLDRPDIDEYNSLLAGQMDARQEDEQQMEQGFGDGMTQMERGRLLKSLRAFINGRLHEHASMVRYELSKKTAPNMFEVGDEIEQTLRRQIERAPRELTSAMKQEAKALGISEESILAGLQRQQDTNAKFLNLHRHRILEVIGRLECDQLDEESAESTFDKLPVMDRFRLWAAADSGLYFAGESQGQRWVVYKVQEGKDNLAVINAERHKLRVDINNFLKEPSNKRGIAEAMAAGANIPALQPLPPTQEELKKAATK